VGAWAVVLSGSRNRRIQIVLVGALFLGLASQMANFVVFRDRMNYRGLAEELRARFSELKIRPVIATTSEEARLAARYYMKGFSVIDCNAKCGAIDHEPHVVWMFHKISLPSEVATAPMVQARIAEGRTLYVARRPGLAGVLVSYDRGKSGTAQSQKSASKPAEASR
jgi:hypothetical protein